MSDGELWKLVQSYIDRQPFAPSYRKVAERLGMSPTALLNWRSDLTSLPNQRNLLAFSDLSGVPYERLLDAALRDACYLPESAARAASTPETNWTQVPSAQRWEAVERGELDEYTARRLDAEEAEWPDSRGMAARGDQPISDAKNRSNKPSSPISSFEPDEDWDE